MEVSQEDRDRLAKAKCGFYLKLHPIREGTDKKGIARQNKIKDRQSKSVKIIGQSLAGNSHASPVDLPDGWQFWAKRPPQPKQPKPGDVIFVGENIGPEIYSTPGHIIHRKAKPPKMTTCPFCGGMFEASKKL